MLNAMRGAAPCNVYESNAEPRNIKTTSGGCTVHRFAVSIKFNLLAKKKKKRHFPPPPINRKHRVVASVDRFIHVGNTLAAPPVAHAR